MGHLVSHLVGYLLVALSHYSVCSDWRTIPIAFATPAYTSLGTWVRALLKVSTLASLNQAVIVK
jgi:hypothetical protein